jgi:hypothetical protein
MSRHQTYIQYNIVSIPVIFRRAPPEYPWKYITPPDVVPKAPIDAANGHGLGSTRWKGCPVSKFPFVFISLI